ncbi:CoA transferase [Meiothermus sp. QL-1]|uniref:CaiB/BaiF CoA transferase family protein n=1 Tax=Meiothermus sp. QL-1 TaxID=2058095 RepID=UPI000E0B44C6|nr:CoA transferase [Meiothermus sp. QL-1]RDI95789.1 CoA transferase [Meiothermus sp. QL-1]
MGALDGVKVLDLSRVLAGPYCTQMLADLGARVWKVEPLWGDETRGWGPPFVPAGPEGRGESAYFLSCNRGKQSLAINLKDPRGQQIVRALAQRADVLVENFKTGDLARYGLDYPSLARLNPGLIYLSITGYGHTGPRAAEPGYDVAIQGLCGIMSVTGEPEGPPMRVPVAWIDLMTGMQGAVAVLAALWERARSGLGQHIDLALFDVGLAAMVNLAQSYLVTGALPPRLGNAHPQIVPYGAFQAADGWFMLTIGNDEQYRRACMALERPELWEDPRFQTNAGRVQHRAALLPELEALFRTRPRQAWLERLRKAGVPATPVHNLAEALADPQAQARGMVWHLEHPTLGRLPLLGSPLAHLSRTPAEPQAPPPLLGQHTEAVLKEVLGLEAKEVEALRAAGVIGG